MVELEYVHILTKAEKEAFIAHLTSKYHDKQRDVQTKIKDNQELLIKAYNDFESSIIEDYRNRIKELINKKKLWEAKRCLCGADMKFNDDFSFWGCPNYKLKTASGHVTFKHNQTELIDNQFQYTKVKLSHNWSSEIIKSCNLNGQITAKELLTFFNNEGLEDLREKYGYKNSMKSISAYPSASKESKREELEIKNYLEQYFSKSRYQLYLKYKLHSQNEKICIIDLIVSDDDYVFLIEIKRHNIYIDEDQINLYYSLLSKLMKESNDSRKLSSLFIVHEYFYSEYNNNKCLVFDDLKNLNTKSSIINSFLKNVFD